MTERSEEAEVTVRDYVPTDDKYIYSTWIRFAYYSPKEPHKLSKREFFKEKSAEISLVLSGTSKFLPLEQRTFVKIACLMDDPSTLIGYIVVKQGKVEWLCVKKTFHNQGIDLLLMRSMKGHIHG